MIADIYELSPLQAGMLFHRIFAPDSTAYFDQFSCRLSGPVRVDLMHRAWQRLVDRHAVLRTSFHWEGLDKPVQVVHTEVALPWETLDWRGVPPDEQSAHWREYLAADRARGFQPDVAPLMRAAIVRLTDEDCYFCWSHHHLLLDGWCLTLVLSEVFATYEALLAGREPRLEAVRPFAEYIKWLQRRDREALERYWRETLRGFSAATPILPIAGRPSSGAAEADRLVDRRLSLEATERLRALAARQRLTLNTLVQGAWALLLSRYSGGEDVVFGATVSGRPPEVPGIETMLGVFINTVPVRIAVPSDATAAAWLGDVQAQQVARDAFAAIPLSDIQKLSDVEPGAPLFTTNVIVMNYRLDEGLARGGAGFEIRDLQIVDQTDVPLTLQVTPGRQLTIEILYDSGRFDADAIERMLGHVEFLLAQFVEDLDRPLAAFEIVTPHERARILTEFNATAAPLDPAQTALDLFEAQAAATPDAIALECDDRRLTFRALDAWANRLARGMRSAAPAGAPLGADRLVAIAFARSERLVAAILAVWKCGAAYLPIDPNYPTERIRQVLDTASPSLVLSDDGTLDDALEAAFGERMRFISIDSIEAAASDARAAASTARSTGGDLAYVIFTSGSTGLPKGAMVEHTGMLNHLLAKIEDFGLGRDSVIVQNASHCFDISVWQCFAAILAGGRTVVYTDAVVLDPAELLRRVRTDRVTVLEVVPSYLAPLLDHADDDGRPLDDLRFLLVTGETVKPSLVERWFARFPSIPLANAYGPTEASDDITHAILREPSTTASVPIGRPLRNFHIYIVDAGLRLCPIGVAGELCVSGPGVGRGYLNDTARTAAVFLEDPFRRERGVRMYRTGDVGWFTGDGTLFLAGRRDHQVKIRGYRIELGDIEAALASLPAVRDAVVVDRHERASSLAAYVTLNDEAATPAEILDALADRLPDYMIPASCTVLPELPLTPNGKIDRKALPVPETQARRDDATYAAPRTAREAALAGIWADVLGVDRPGIHDNFFAVGGDSILSMQIVSRASRAGLALTPRDVFQHQTIAELAEHAREASGTGAGLGQTAGSSGSAAPTIVGPAPLAPAQRQFFTDVTVDRHHYNQSILLETPASVDVDRLGRAFDAVLAHHDALRLRFVEVDGEWRQQVAPFEAQPIERHDLSALTIDAIGARLQASLDIENGPLVRVAYFAPGAGATGRLLIAVHHLAIDGVSWRTVLEDFATAYAALETGANVSLPPVGTSYLAWASAQPAHAIVRPNDDPRNTADSTGEIAIVADAVAMRPTEILLTSFALAYGDWRPARAGRHVTIDVETHGRDEVEGDERFDVSRTVGWFTRTTPVSFDLAAHRRDPGELVALAAAQLRDATDAARATDSTGASRIEPRPALLMNYHGRVDRDAPGAWRLSNDPHGPDRSGRQQREHAIEMNALVSDGKLRISLTFSRNLHEESDIVALTGHLERHLAAVRAQADIEDVYPLSPTQQGLLFHSVFEDTSGAYFNQLTCVLRGALDVAAFQRAWQRVAARHAVLRASFHWRELERPVQVVHARAEIPWLIEDWSGRAAGEVEERWHQLGVDDRRRPFDVSKAPLLRCALVRTAAETWRFRWSQHHLLLDGWSASIVLGDVLDAYHALVRGRRVDAPAPPPFRHYVNWLHRQDAAASVQFWSERLAGFDTPTPLVLGLPEMDGVARLGKCAEAEREIPRALGERLLALAAANRVTLNTLFQGVWALLLARHSGTSDVVFGAIASGRPTELDGADRMVGLFINTVPVRARLEPARPVFDWLRDLQVQQSACEPHSYSSLADVQRASEVPGGAALFESILIFENYPVGASAADRALSIDDVRAFEPNNYPITFVVTPGRSIGLKIMFDEGRFDRATIERTLGHVLTLVAGIADRPDEALDALPMLTPAERAEIDAWNRTEKTVPAGETVPRLIEARARRTPGRPAVICEGRTVTYGELDRRANQLARAIQATGRCGANVADAPPGIATDGIAPRVVVLLRRSERLPEAVLALWKCGAVYVPVDPEYPAARIRALIDNARPALVIAGTASGPGVAAAREAARRQDAALLVLEDVGAGDDAAVGSGVDPSAVAYVIYTSGSTGVPKGAMVEHAGFLNHVLSMIDDLSLDAASVVAQTASQGFDISMWQLFAALVAGGTTAIYPDALVHRPEALAVRFNADRVTVAQFVPSYLNVFLDAAPDANGDGAGQLRLETLTHMVTIGEALTAPAIARWFARFPHIPLMNAYGPTEASDSVAHADFTRPLGHALVPIGRPIRNTRLYILDAAMRLCPIGAKGEIAIAGLGVGRGYLFDEARTNEVFVSDPFRADPQRMYRTGDVGCYRPDGRLLFFGRRDHQVKIRGHRIELGEIESALAAIDGVRDAAAVIHDRGAGDRVLCTYVTGQAGASLDAGRVTAALSGVLPHHAVPDVVKVLDEMPVMSNGKIDRRALAARDVVSPDAPYSAEPRTDAEWALARIWSAVLGRDRIGIDDSFFDLGGHSLKAIQIVSRIHRESGAEIGVGDLFERQTIRQLAPLVETAWLAASAPESTSAAGSVPGALVAQPDQETYDVSPTQMRMWLASRTPDGSAAYNMAGAFWLDGRVDEGALARAFNALVDRHEALRTVFEMREGALRQRVLPAAQVADVCTRTDLRRRSLGAEALDAVIRETIARPFDLARGPLFAVDLFRAADERWLLLVRLHHIVGDAASIRVILNEAREAYAAFHRGEAASPLQPLAVQYRDFVAWQKARSEGGTRAESRRYWMSALGGPLPRTGFAPDTPPPARPAAPAAGSRVVACDLDAALTGNVRALAARHHTTPFAVVVSAVYALLYRYRQQDDLVVGSTISRRDHPLLEEQVGCYIDLVALRGRAGGRDTPDDLVERTARVCRDALAHRDYPFDSLIADLDIATPAGKPPLFDVLVDYAPVPAGSKAAKHETGFVIAEYERGSDAAHYDTMFVLGESDSGDELSIRLVFNAALFGDETAALISARFMAIVNWLAGDGAGTLGEVELVSAPATPRRRLRVGLNTS